VVQASGYCAPEISLSGVARVAKLSDAGNRDPPLPSRRLLLSGRDGMAPPEGRGASHQGAHHGVKDIVGGLGRAAGSVSGVP
jgi:hypothetical protein